MLPTYFIITYARTGFYALLLHARKVTIKEGKQLETTQVILCYEAIVDFWWYVSGPKVMLVSIVILNEAKHKTFRVRDFHCETNMCPCIFSLCYFLKLHFFIFDLLFSTPITTDNFVANEKHMVLKCSCDPSFRRSHWNNMVHHEHSIDVLKYIPSFGLSFSIQKLFYCWRKRELYASYHICLIS